MPSRVPSERVVFGSFNQFWKISDASVALWLAILRQVPDARLTVIGVPAGTAMATFRDRLEQGGVAGERITLLPRLDIHGYFKAIGDVDIALDTQPYNGATTTLDALACGVPVVALTGDRSVARSGTSILRTLGVPELVAADADEYVSINAAAGTRPGLARAPAQRASASARALASDGRPGVHPGPRGAVPAASRIASRQPRRALACAGIGAYTPISVHMRLSAPP